MSHYNQRSHPGLPTWTNLEAPTFYATRKTLQLLDQRSRTIHRLFSSRDFLSISRDSSVGNSSSPPTRPRPRFVVCLLSSRDLASGPTRGSHCPCDIRPSRPLRARSAARIALSSRLSIRQSSHCACECAPSGTGRPLCLILIILPATLCVHLVRALVARTDPLCPIPSSLPLDGRIHLSLSHLISAGLSARTCLCTWIILPFERNTRRDTLLCARQPLDIISRAGSLSVQSALAERRFHFFFSDLTCRLSSLQPFKSSICVPG